MVASNSLKIFTSDSSAWTADQSVLSPILAFHWQGLATAERRDRPANSASPFILVDDAAGADFHILPYEWNHYIWKQRIGYAQAQGRLAATHGRQILVWHSGDLPPVVPLGNAITLQSALYRSRLRPHQHAVPSFVDDPLQHRDGQVTPRRKSDKPVVGFCGYAGVVPLKIAYGVYGAMKHNLLFRAGRAAYEPMPLVPATLLRASALRALSADSRVQTRFLVNTRAFKRHDQRTAPETRAQQVSAFLGNLEDSDYTLCVRGYGNWSRRFYETLAAGRIPLFINTDCVLPWRGQINWRDYCVWVEQDEVADIGDRLLAFHSRLSSDELLEKQRRCRRLWEERLSLAGFMDHLFEELSVHRTTEGPINRLVPNPATRFSHPGQMR